MSFVLPDYRGRGIGTELLSECVQIAQQRGCARMEWTCLDWNTQAQQKYEKMGARRLNEWLIYRLDRTGIDNRPRNEVPSQNPQTVRQLSTVACLKERGLQSAAIDQCTDQCAIPKGSEAYSAPELLISPGIRLSPLGGKSGVGPWWEIAFPSR